MHDDRFGNTKTADTRRARGDAKGGKSKRFLHISSFYIINVIVIVGCFQNLATLRQSLMPSSMRT